MLTYIVMSVTIYVVSVTIYVMSVTMYVTSANYICYERLKYPFFEVKTLLLYLLPNTIRL